MYNIICNHKRSEKCVRKINNHYLYFWEFFRPSRLSAFLIPAFAGFISTEYIYPYSADDGNSCKFFFILFFDTSHILAEPEIFND